MTNRDTNEKLVAVGKWLYDGTIESVVHIVQTSTAYDIEGPDKMREDREGPFYYLRFFSLADPEVSCGMTGAFDSVELAKKYAKEMCTSLVWN